MKKSMYLHLVLACALLLGWAATASAQFNGVRTQFLMTSLLDNPAAAGNSACLDLRMGGRNQWAGFDGAPRTSFASLSGRLGGGVTFAHGMGGFVVTDQVGPWSNTRLSLAYSTKVRLTNGARLSAGLAAGMTQYRLDIGSLVFPEFSATEDPALFGASTSQTVFPTLDFGLWYENSQTFVSLSMLNAVPTTLNEVTMTTNTGTTFVLMGGQYIKLDRRFGFRPAAQMRLTRGLPPSVDLQGAFSVDELVSVG
ncbi:MAG: PorP/SprF family type IX secretion system membrane protein, partial [Flavobacteriales bacterium]